MSAERIVVGDARINVAADGKRFRCDFIREGPVNYPEIGAGIECIRRATIEAGLNSYLGKPLVLDHIDPRLNVDDPAIFAKYAHGKVDKVGFDRDLGWFFCEGEVTTDEARAAALTRNPSCAFNVLQKGGPGRWNNVPYTQELTAIEFHHLALDKRRPRYEEADFRLNAVQNPTTGETTMFKLIRKIAAKVTGEQPTEETIELAPETVVDLGNGKTARLNALVTLETPEEAAAKEKARIKKIADEKEAADKARLNALSDDSTEVEVNGKRVTLKDLKAGYEARENAVQAEATRAASEAEAGRQAFAKLQQARDNNPPIRTDFPATADSREERLKRGVY